MTDRLTDRQGGGANWDKIKWKNRMICSRKPKCGPMEARIVIFGSILGAKCNHFGHGRDLRGLAGRQKGPWGGFGTALGLQLSILDRHLSSLAPGCSDLSSPSPPGAQIGAPRARLKLSPPGPWGLISEPPGPRELRSEPPGTPGLRSERPRPPRPTVAGSFLGSKIQQIFQQKSKGFCL